MVDPGGSSDESQDGLSPGTRLGKYEIVRLLGSGGMGAVYEAAHTEIGKRVAVKVLSPAIAAVPGARARFLREAQLTSRVRHPNIVDVTDMGSDAGQTYLVMEFLRGEDLAQRLGRTGPLPPQQLADIMLPVCSAVVEAHKAGITHRDLKPQNIFLAVGPHTTQPKVLDFGISKGNDIPGAGSLTGTGAMIGTPFYLAPEQIMDTRSAGPNSDQYALGVIMYECLTGQRPFEAENLFVVFQAIVSGNPIPPSHRRPGIPAALEAVVMRAMNLAPSARFPSILSLGRALLPFASMKMRSIWEEAFAGSGEMAVVEETPAALETSAAPLTPPPTSLLTPAGPGRQGSAGPVNTPGGRVRGSLGAQTPAAEGSSRRATSPLMGAAGAWPGNAASGGEIIPDMRGRSRSVKVAGILAVVVVVGLIGGVVLRRAKIPETEAAVAPTRAVTVRAPAAAAEAPQPPSLPAAESERAGQRSAAEEATGAGADSPTPDKESEAASSRTYRVSVRVDPDDASLELDGAAAGTGNLERTLPVDDAHHKLRVTAAGYEPKTVDFTAESPPPGSIKLKRAGRSRGSNEDWKSRSVSRPTRLHVPSPSPTPFPARNLNPNGAPVID